MQWGLKNNRTLMQDLIPKMESQINFFKAINCLLYALCPFIKVITDNGKNFFELLFIMDYRMPELIN